MSIGSNIKKLRKERKKTQQELANEIGISRTYLTDLENNKRNTSTATLKKLSDKLGVSMAYLTTGRKVLDDLTEEELVESMRKSGEKLQERTRQLKNSLSDSLVELSKMDLEYMETLYLHHAIEFMKDSHANDMVTFTGIFNQYNRYKNIYHETGDKEDLLEEIEYIKNQLDVVFQTRYGLAQYEEGD